MEIEEQTVNETSSEEAYVDPPSSEEPNQDYESGTEYQEAEPSEPSYNEEDAALAQKFGWKPPDEWKGDKSNYIDNPVEFLANMKNRLESTATLQDQLQATRQELLAIQQRQHQQEEMGFRSHLEQLRAERDKAAEFGDMQRFRQLDQQIDRLRAGPPQTGPDPVEYQRKADLDPEFVKFQQQNSWYNDTSPDGYARTAYANEVAAKIIRQHNIADPLSLPDQQRAAFYQTVAQEVDRFFGGNKPSSMGGQYNASQQRAPARQGQMGSQKKTFNNLPRDAQDTFQHLVKKGIYKDSADDKKHYVTEYFASQAKNKR